MKLSFLLFLVTFVLPQGVFASCPSSSKPITVRSLEDAQKTLYAFLKTKYPSDTIDLNYIEHRKCTWTFLASFIQQKPIGISINIYADIWETD